MTEPTTIPIILDFCRMKFGWFDWKIENKWDQDRVVCHPVKNWEIELRPMTIKDGSHCISLDVDGKKEGSGGAYRSFGDVEETINRRLLTLGLKPEDVQMTIFDL